MESGWAPLPSHPDSFFVIPNRAEADSFFRPYAALKRRSSTLSPSVGTTEAVAFPRNQSPNTHSSLTRKFASEHSAMAIAFATR
jgi:hypothetical protein